MMKLPQPPNLNTNQKTELARRLTRYAAYSVMPLIRRQLGYRALSPFVLAFICAALMFISGFGDPVHRPQDVRYFAIAMLVAGLIQRIARWRSLGQSHTYYIGDSRLQSLRWPAWMQRNRIIPRFVDPIFVCVTGFALFKLGSPLLGIWLMFSGASLRWLEYHIYQREFSHRLDTGDGLIESEEHGEYVAQHSAPPRQHQNQSDEPGLPTGINHDIRDYINRNKK